MIYLTYFILTLLFVYNTPLWNKIIDFIESNPMLITLIFIFGDFLFGIGLSVIAAYVYADITGGAGFVFFTLLNNWGTILAILGATIRILSNKS